MDSARSMHSSRLPGSIEEARSLVAYNERILQTSRSGQRLHRAERMLINLQPVLERLEREESERMTRIAAAAPPASTFEGQLQRRVRDRDDETEFETVWNGGEGLTTYQQGPVLSRAR